MGTVYMYTTNHVVPRLRSPTLAQKHSAMRGGRCCRCGIVARCPYSQAPPPASCHPRSAHLVFRSALKFLPKYVGVPAVADIRERCSDAQDSDAHCILLGLACFGSDCGCAIEHVPRWLCLNERCR